MRELRKDPVVGRWIILSSERRLRPSDFQDADPPASNGGRETCPFCPGHEAHTPPEILAFRDHGAPNEPGWTTRVFPNKFPALRVEETLERRGEGLYDRMSGVGAHEVIVESPEHEKDLSELPAEQIERVLEAYKERILDLKKDARLQYVLVFKNAGRKAGASLEHGHSQLIATPIVPRVVMEELEGSRAHWEAKERCVFCDMIDHERKDGRRVVLETEGFLAIEPYAPRFPFETWILPRRHRAGYEDASTQDLKGFASILKETLGRIRRALDHPHYNFVLHTAPWTTGERDSYHWHLEIMPKRTPAAGFEWGSGFHINPTAPEEAADYLRGLRA
ncbi:MAG TPA: galactose-1-phosphate uridylyltransferase [Candidatus Eisenbacteria bacterium]|jgi:UDPglucose--hexose-1-phosphate uridylyltransferase|nr:galactose-1-phosphate uridylyltransferase [Candidatus Eisenbacteria bacterium]HZV91390.1 galactose-1-phosphate uridylyltransferase [Candidatus Nitrosocosmicus sp.]